MPKLAFSILVVASLHSCKKEVIEKSNAITTTTSAARDNDEMMVLGNQLQNPYSVTNMLIAYQNLRAGNPSFPAMEITTTHRYLKFSPVDTTEFDKLVADTTIEFYDHPLDYEIVKNGNFYRDPELDPSIPFTHQYCVVPINQSNAPSAPNVVLAELYLPNEHTDNPFIEDLVDEALRITNNVDSSSLRTGRVNGKKYNPKGTIKLWDDKLVQSVAVVGAEVRVRRWFETRSKITDGNGYFKIDEQFKNDVNFSIKWERNHWDIRSGLFGQAYYNGPDQRGDWNLEISSGLSRLYAITHIALLDYYYGNRFGLKSPPVTGSKMKVCVYEKDTDDNGSYCKDCRRFGLLGRIYIYSNSRNADAIYGTVIHEIAHASHWELRKGSWNSIDGKVVESWARGVQRQITRLRYTSYQPAYFGDYTGIVEDLIDGKSGYDQVEGYTLKQIEDVLGNTQTWQNWEDNLKNTYTNSTENELQNLFNYW